MIELTTNRAFRVTLDPSTSLVRLVRGPIRYEAIEDFEQLHVAAARLFDQLGRARHVLLVDTRAATMATNPAFERIMSRLRPLLVRDFVRSAVLVRSAIGALQTNRLHRADPPPPIPVFQDESDALTFLLGADADTERQPPPRSGIVDNGRSTSRDLRSTASAPSSSRPQTGTIAPPSSSRSQTGTGVPPPSTPTPRRRTGGF